MEIIAVKTPMASMVGAQERGSTAMFLAKQAEPSNSPANPDDGGRTRC